MDDEIAGMTNKIQLKDDQKCISCIDNYFFDYEGKNCYEHCLDG